MKKTAAILLAACFFGASASAWYEFEETRIGEYQNGGLTKYNGTVVQTWYLGYTGANMNEYRSPRTWYDLTDGVVTVKPKVYFTMDIEGSDNKISYYTEGESGWKRGFSLVGANGEVIIAEDEYYFMYPYEGTILVNKDDRYGVISADGDIIKPVETKLYLSYGGFDDKFEEGNGLAVVQKSIDGEKKYGIINARLEMLSDYEYDWAAVRNDCIQVEKDGEAKRFDREMNEIPPPTPAPTMSVENIDRVYISTVGNVGIKIRRDEIARVDTGEVIMSADEGFEFWAASDSELVFTSKERSGLMNGNGTVIVEFPFKANIIRHAGDGFFSAVLDDGYHIFDASGRDVLGEGYDSVVRLDNGIYAVMKAHDGLYMLASRTIDVAYNTQIRTFINNAEIPCCLIDGYCAIVAEDLRGYGFDVIWNAEEQRLDISRNPEYYKINPVEIPAKAENNTPYADVVKSYIKVYYEGTEIKSYHIDGRTLIRPESIEDDGISFNYADGILNINVDGLEYK